MNMTNPIEEKMKEFEEEFAKAGIIGDRKFKEYLPNTYESITSFLQTALTESRASVLSEIEVKVKADWDRNIDENGRNAPWDLGNVLSLIEEMKK